MKKVTLLAALIMMTVVSCKKDAPPPPPPPPVPAEAPAPPPPPPVEDRDESNGTSVKVGKDGVDVSTKSNNGATKVEVKDGKGSVEVKKD